MAPKADAKSKPKPKKEPKKKEEAEDVPRVEEPDQNKWNADKQVITDKMDAVEKKLKELNNKIGEKSHGRDDFQAKKSKLLEALTREGSAIAELKAAKDHIMDSLKSANSQAREAKNDLKKMRQEVRYNSTADIDEKIKQLDFKLISESLTLHEEKKVLEEIKQLKKNKPLVNQVNAKQAQVEEMGTVDTSTMKEKLGTIKQEMDNHFTRKQEYSAQLDALKTEREAKTGDVKGLYDERDALQEEKRKHKKELEELNDVYYQAQKKFRDYRREIRDKQWQEQQAQNEARQEERKMEARRREVEKLDEMPHQHDINLLEQTIKFCKSFGKKEEKKEEEKKETSYDNPDTHLVLKNKGDREEEYYFAPAEKKKGKKAKKGGDGGSKAIKHNAETFRLFTALKMECPVTTDDIPKTLEKLEAELENFLQKVKKWEEEKEEQKKRILAGDTVEEAEDKGEAAEEKQD